MKKLLTVLWVMAMIGSHAQEGNHSLIPAEQINTRKAQGKIFTPIDLFDQVEEKSQMPFFSDNRLEQAAIIQPKSAVMEQFLYERPENIALSLPLEGGQSIELELVKVRILTDDFLLHSVSGQVGERPAGVFYRGTIKDDPQSAAAISIFGDEIKGIVSDARFGNLVLSKIEENGSLHALYKDEQLLREQTFDCGAEDSGIAYTTEELQSPPAKNLSGCVRIYFEVDYDVYQDKGSLDNVGKYVTSIFNEVTLLYANENVNVEISEIRVWDQPSPYSGSSSSEMLDQFQSERTSFNGDLGQLLSYQASGGIAVLRGLCHPYTRAKLSFASIRSSFNTYPNYSYTVMVVAHELGHLMGSQHTHACVWNGNNTAIDGCAGFTEGSCALAPVPTGGGTIMSYCHITQVGINFSKGFGTQPGNVIRNFVDNATCVQACSGSGGGGGGGGGDPDPEPGCTEVTLDLRLDTYAPETSWELKNADNVVLFKGGPYAKDDANQQMLESFCLNEGCYTFTIRDAYDDGICCKYGQGGYQLSDQAGNDLGSGSDFKASQTQKFCIEGGSGSNGNGDCEQIDFSQYSIDSYGGLQDIGVFELQEGGTVLKIANNAWKSIALNYTVTANTMMTVDFRSDQQGEIHGIGFDNNDQISFSQTFKLHGIQNWGVLNFDNYAGSSWKTYTIPVGDFYQGSYNRLFFVADHDGGYRNGTSYYRNIRIYEGTDCGEQQLPPAMETISSAPALSVYPNPADRQLELQFDMPGGGVAELKVYNLFGQIMDRMEWDTFEGVQSETIDIEQFPPGTYILEIMNEEQKFTRKFNVAR